MKRIFLAIVILALTLPALQKAKARTDVSIDFFYDNLGDGGNWIEAGEYGYAWQPTVAVSNTSWRPYSDGYWAYTDLGWTWISYEDFGWATYHYGRWIRLRGRGWVWVPGREWGPAWVSWRTGGDYVGWAPLPPRRPGQYWDERPITARVDIDFDIGPGYYNFIDVRYIGEPVLRERIFAPEQNVTYITKTVNVTNITYNNSRVYNYGPDYNTVSRYSTRPIQRLSLQRETNVDPATAAQSKSLMKVQGDKLLVAAPQQFQKPSKPVAPKVVKEKIAHAPVEKGWEPVGDPKVQAELKEKIRKEDPKSVPPPTVQASDKAATSPGASTAPATTPAPATTAASATAAPVATLTPVAKSPAPTTNASVSPTKDKKKRNEKASPSPAASASVSPAATPATSGKNKNKRNEKAAPPTSPPASVSPATTAPPPRDKGKNKQNAKTTPIASAPARMTPPPTADKKHEKPAATPKPTVSIERSKHQPPPDMTPKMKRAAPRERVQPPAPGPKRAPKDAGKKQKKNEPAASPTR